MHSKKQPKERVVLVTGSSGLIGTALVQALAKKGINVVGCDIKKPPSGNFKFEKCNLLFKNEVSSLFQRYDFSQVIHLASYVTLGNVNSAERKKIFRANVVATFNLVSAMEEHAISRIIFASSMTVYGFPKYLPVNESHPLDPVGFYGFSKAAAEEVVKSFSDDYLILRFPGVFAFHRKRGGVYNFILRAIQGKDIHILADTPMPWDIIFIDDVVGAITAALERPAKNAIVNIGYGEPVELVSLARKIVALSGSRSKVIAEQAVGHPVFCLGIKKAETLLGFTPPTLNVRLNQFIDFVKHEQSSF